MSEIVHQSFEYQGYNVLEEEQALKDILSLPDEDVYQKGVELAYREREAGNGRQKQELARLGMYYAFEVAMRKQDNMVMKEELELGVPRDWQ